MAYLFCSAFSILLFTVAKSTTGKAVVKLSYNANRGLLVLPFVYWVILIGTQYYVGTDYPTYYLNFATGNTGVYWYKKEYIFAFIADTIYSYRLNPQTGFVVFAFLQSIIFCFFINKYRFKRYDLLLFIYFYCGTVFVNQTNAVRQYTAMYIFLFAIIYIYKRQFIRYVLCIIIASMFHISALFLFPIYFFDFLFNKKSRKLFFIYIILTFILFYTGIDFFVLRIVEKTDYKYYLQNDLYILGNRRNIIFFFTKLIFLPFYVRFLFSKMYNSFSSKEKYFINLGFVCYCVKLISMASFFLGRFAMYFDFLSYIPLYYYMLYLIENKNINKNYRLFELFIFLSFTVGPYLMKVLIFPDNEYIYKSVLYPYL